MDDEEPFPLSLCRESQEITKIIRKRRMDLSLSLVFILVSREPRRLFPLWRFARRNLLDE
jgi:hypothetical protein